MAELRTPQGHTLLLPEGRVSFGSDPSVEVPVAPRLGLAPVHFRLQPWQGGYFIEDAGSGLGTLVNGHPVNWKPLEEGDVIIAGELEVVYSRSSPTPGRTESVALPSPPAPALPPPPLESTTSRMTANILPPLPAEPPAWLPVDLLPETVQARMKTLSSPAGSSEVEATPPSSFPALPPPVATAVESLKVPAPPPLFLPSAAGAPRQPRKSRKHRFLSLAALLALLTWAGVSAVQHGFPGKFMGSAPPPESPEPARATAANKGSDSSVSPLPQHPPDQD